MIITNRRRWASGICLLCVLGLFACGRPTGKEQFQARDDEPPPETAGSLESLVGTTWELSKGQTLTFGEGGEGTASKPTGIPSPMRYELDSNGVIRIFLPGSSRSGTWDGTTLIIGGETLQPMSESRDPVRIPPTLLSP